MKLDISFCRESGTSQVNQEVKISDIFEDKAYEKSVLNIMSVGIGEKRSCYLTIG